MCLAVTSLSRADPPYPVHFPTRNDEHTGGKVLPLTLRARSPSVPFTLRAR
ncbi:hypothetical protein SSCG_01669 [Streptomyces clavuligerus]|nr:hypothetical protein SSCG_01669 [Streptomyces clavuligerus]